MSLTEAQTAALRKKIMLAIAQPIEPVPRTSDYRLRLFTVSLVTMIIMFLYVAIILLAAGNAFGLFGFGFGSVGSMGSRRSAAAMFLLTTVAPSFASFCVVVALIKPLFVQPAKDSEDSDMELSKEHEPYLFEFVERLCISLGSPIPSSIVVDANVNASASYLHGPWDKRLRLTIGLPLILGLNTRQLSGVLAHEFGHFTQRGGMFLTWLIRTVNMWLYRAAFERDRWDQWLEESSHSWDIRVGWILYFARGVVWVARLALKGLFMVGAYFCSGLMQEMEYDADRFEARLAGSRCFATTCRQMHLLNLCHAGAVDDLDRFKREGRLPDNLPALVVANVPLVPKELLRKFEEKSLELETGKFDTHPSDRDRIVNAANEQAAGSFQIEAPGAVLFRDAKGLSRLVTIKLYKSAFGKKFQPKQVHSTDELIGQLNRETAESRAGMNFLLNQFCMYRTFTLPRQALGAEIDTANWKETASSRREKLLRAATRYMTMRRESSEIAREIAQVAAVQKLLNAKFDLSLSSAKFIVNDARGVRTSLLELSRRETAVMQKLEPFRQMLGLRLMDALELTRSPKILEKIGEPTETATEINQILRCWKTIADRRMIWDRLLLEAKSAIWLLPLIEETSDERVVQALMTSVRQLHDYLVEIKSVCSDIHYPFSHAKGNVSLGYYLIKKVSSRDDYGQVIEDSMELIKSTGIVMQRCASRLASIAEKVEGAFGLQPLELPPELTEIEEEDDEAEE